MVRTKFACMHFYFVNNRTTYIHILFSYTFVLIYENINIILFGAFPTKTARLELAPETSQQATQLMRPAGRNASCVDGFWVQIYPRYFSGKCT